MNIRLKALVFFTLMSFGEFLLAGTPIRYRGPNNKCSQLFYIQRAPEVQSFNRSNSTESPDEVSEEIRYDFVFSGIDDTSDGFTSRNSDTDAWDNLSGRIGGPFSNDF